MHFLRLLALVVFFSPMPYGWSQETVGLASSEQMQQATVAFLERLDSEQREKVTFDFADSERRNWDFVPKQRPGLSWREMNLQQRQAGHKLLVTALSGQGYNKANAIMWLEQQLRRIESDRPNVNERRDPEKYWFAVFGDPAGDQPWGWRIEGHHLSLNFSSATGRVIATTPAFFGANPAEVREGPRAGLRVLGNEADLAFRLIESCGEQQRQAVIIAEVAPDDILALPDVEINFGQPEGLEVEAMNAYQQSLLRQLLAEIIGNFPGPVAQQTWDEIEEAGFEKIHFAWAGSTTRDAGHYFRIHGPTLVVEYDNTQNNANHAHLVWHSPTNNFGADFLLRHYTESPHHQGGEDR